MVLISIQPFHFGKLLLLVAAVLFLSSAYCLGDPLFMSVRATMTDHRANRVQRTFGTPLSQCGEKQTETSEGANSYAAISFLAEPQFTAHAEIAMWLGVTELPGYSWSDFPR